MTTETTHVYDAASRPLACTLTLADQKTRVQEWRALRREALLDERHDGLVWTSLWRADPDVRARLEALVAGERECCSFLTFEVEEVDGGIRMRTLVPPGAEAVASAFIR